MLYSYSVASAGPSSVGRTVLDVMDLTTMILMSLMTLTTPTQEEDSVEQMELEHRGIEMDASNPSYKRYRAHFACFYL